jgi:hypothetical protein
MEVLIKRDKIDLIKDKIEKKSVIKEAAEEALKGTTAEAESLKEKIAYKALDKVKED